MINYKQILEAVNRGIQLALDDFEDDEVQNIKSKQVQNRDYTKEYLDFQKLIIKLKNNLKNNVLTKQEFDKLVKLSKLLNLKYTVDSKDELKDIIRYITVYVDREANLNWIDTSKITNMDYLFLESEFNGDISEWDVSNVESMYSMFAGSKFNGDISNWDVSNVKDMRYMFQNTQFNQNISNWNVSNISLFDQAGINRAMGIFMYCSIKNKYMPIFNNG